MIYVAAVDSGDGAIVDVSLTDSLLLGGACDQTFEAIRSDDDFVPRTGYPAHFYEYLSVWMLENQPDAAQRLAHKAKQESLARLKNNLGSPTASELLLATKIDDIDASTVRWNLSLAALQMFDAGIREILDYFADTNPPYVELELLAGGTEEEFRTLQQNIKDVLEAVALAAPQAAVSPSAVSVTAPSLARGDEESVPYDDELVAVDLTARERGLLATGLQLWGGPAQCTEAMALAMGFDSVNDLVGQYDRLKGLLGRKKKPMSRTDWARTLLATEVCFASVVVGAGLAWGDDISTLRALRIVQSKIATAGALTAWEGCRYPTDVCRVAARRDRGQYVTNNDELVEVALTTAESSLLVTALGDLWGPAAPTDAMAIAIGFDSVEDLIDQYRHRLKDLIQRRAALMSITDWIRTLLATEISTVSWVEGAGGEWGSAVDDASIQALRGLQEKLARMGALGRKRSAVDPADSAPTAAPPESIRPCSPAVTSP